jgi:hypothetical protein
MTDRPARHHRLGSPRGLPSVETHRALNRAKAAEGRDRAIHRLVCQERGCREGLATIELDPESAEPRLRLVVRAPWAAEETTDRRALHRIRLRGATSPDADAVYLRLPDWPRGARLEIICRHGHESRFGAGHIAQRLRTLLHS